MKKICITSILLFIIFLTVGCGYTQNGRITENEQFLRIHVRANSNDGSDQSIKYIIKDAIVNYLTPYIADCQTKDDAVAVITAKKSELEYIIDKILNQNGFTYLSKVNVKNENFPTRVYDGVTLKSGYYDAVIVELGEAKGDNWWCVVYPPLCFSSAENVTYRSKIVEIIKKFFSSEG